ncbi:MAG TPA: tetraacyldisaccharide 4'-kinase [Rikenellaceae bacterium]|nr:MAG: tetraacyldisaccharide 4'-kinase [Bacteroidetes bacterium GWE2_40_15]HBZ25763.1 tetraacyldisaccharide 4'-kinase [Rikenellaceae bacterium]
MKSFFINKIVLFPYYLTLKIRHYLYDNGIFKSYKFDLPVISIGNISAGGTGKTPHTEFIVKELLQDYRVAVLSRGYGRRSKGFRFVETTNSALEAGDEPLQIKMKFPGVTVAVDGDRVRGINTLMQMEPPIRPEVIVMDDAFQHRRVIPGLSLLLIDYRYPPQEDNLLPVGRLRDLPEQMKRADAVIVTKCPPELSDQEIFMWRNQLMVMPHQKLLFSAIQYGEPVAIFEEGDKRYTYSNFAILLTAIANPKPLEYHLLNRYKIIKKVHYRDHHYFTKYDASKINSLVKKYPKAVIFTTEKDSQRLKGLARLSSETKKRIFSLPIEVAILNGNGEILSKLLKESIIG